MAALTANKAHDEILGIVFAYDVEAGAKIFGGALVAINAAGNAVPGSSATGLKAAGRAKSLVDNTGGIAGAAIVQVEEGVFCWDNSAAGDAITKADVGAVCYIVDDHTVAKTDATGTRSVAGFIRCVDIDGVWVESHPYYAALVA